VSSGGDGGGCDACSDGVSSSALGAGSGAVQPFGLDMMKFERRGGGGGGGDFFFMGKLGERNY
jgi:hypothetical protein